MPGGKYPQATQSSITRAGSFSHTDCFTNNGILTGRRQNCLVVRDVGLAGHFCWSPAKTKGVSLGNCLTLPGFPFLSFLVVSKKTC